MASITEISVEHIHNAYESIRGNIAVEAFYAVVTGFMAVTLIHRLYTVYREVQSNEDGTPTPRSKKILAGTPMGRFVASEELLGGVFFLCDDKAASAITGVVLPIDAGFSAYSGV